MLKSDLSKGFISKLRITTAKLALIVPKLREKILLLENVFFPGRKELPTFPKFRDLLWLGKKHFQAKDCNGQREKLLKLDVLLNIF